MLPEDVEPDFPPDPFAARTALDDPSGDATTPSPSPVAAEAPRDPSPRDVVHTALCVEAREGRLHVFMPPLTRCEDYLALVAEVEHAAAALRLVVTIEGYPPPSYPASKVAAVAGPASSR